MNVLCFITIKKILTIKALKRKKRKKKKKLVSSIFQIRISHCVPRFFVLKNRWSVLQNDNPWIQPITSTESFRLSFDWQALFRRISDAISKIRLPWLLIEKTALAIFAALIRKKQEREESSIFIFSHFNLIELITKVERTQADTNVRIKITDAGLLSIEKRRLLEKRVLILCREINEGDASLFYFYFIRDQ